MRTSSFIKSAFVVLCLPLFTFLLSSCGGSGYSHITGRYVSIPPDNHYLLLDSEDETENIIKLIPAPDTNVVFSDLTTGDTVKIKIVMIQNEKTYSYAEVFDYSKEHDGTEDDVSSDILDEIYQLESIQQE